MNGHVHLVIYWLLLVFDILTIWTRYHVQICVPKSRNCNNMGKRKAPEVAAKKVAVEEEEKDEGIYHIFCEIFTQCYSLC